MKILEPSYIILTPISEGGLDELKLIERIARVCYKSEDKIIESGESAKKMIGGLIRSNHLAMLEHSMLSVLFTVDRAISHEQVRHREASFAQESTRYVNYSGNKTGGHCQFIDIKGGVALDKSMQSLSAERIDDILKVWMEAMSNAEYFYNKLIKMGASPQIARSVLPNSTKTEITITANYREWRHIFALRAVGTTGDPHPQMLEIMVPLLKEVSSKIPVVFDDLVEML